MGFFHRLALLALPLASIVVCSEPEIASQTPSPTPLYANAQEAFRDLLNALPEESLHAALNSLTPFQNGVFESDRHGVERVHHENPPLATKLIIAAVQDLKKRQGGEAAPTNGTSSAAPSETPEPSPSSEKPSDKPSETPTDTPGVTPSDTPSESPSETPNPPASTSKTPQPPAVQVPITKTETNSEGKTTVVSSHILSEPTASVVVTTTRVNSGGKSEVVTETKPAIVLETTNSAGETVTSTSAVDFAPTPGQVITTTDPKGSTLYTTYTPSGGRVSSVKLITTTNGQGQPEIITEYTYVEPTPATSQDGDSPSETQNGNPGLQSGIAQKNYAMGAAVMGGALGGFFAIFM